MTSVSGRDKWRFSKNGMIALGAALFFGLLACFPAHSFGEASEGEAAHTREDPELENGISFDEDVTLLLEIPEDSSVVADSVRAYPIDGLVALVYQSGPDRFRVCVNDSCGPYVERVAKGMPVISPNSRHWAAIVRRSGRTHVLLNGQMGSGYDMVQNLIFSPDSMKLAYAARQDGEVHVFVNQDRYGPVYNTGADGLVFSNDSKHLAFAAQTGKNTWTLMLNGEPGPVYEGVMHVTFSPDSGRLAYAARKRGQWRVVVENLAGDGRQLENPVARGRESAEEGYSNIRRIVFCPETGRLGYVARTGKGDILILEGAKNSAVHDLIASGPLFSIDGKRMAYMAMEKGRRDKIFSRMVVDHVPSPAFDQIAMYFFAPDGDLVYMAQKGQKGMFVRNNRMHEPYESVGVPVFAPKTGRLAYPVLKDGKWAMNEDGNHGPAFDWISEPVFSPDGNRLAYQGLIEGDSIFESQFLIIEGETVLGTYSWAGLPAFSPDGKHLAYAAADEGEAFLVIDGQKGKERFLSFLKGSRLVFTDERTLQGLALGDDVKAFYLIRANIDRSLTGPLN